MKKVLWSRRFAFIVVIKGRQNQGLYLYSEHRILIFSMKAFSLSIRQSILVHGNIIGVLYCIRFQLLHHENPLSVIKSQ